MGSDRTAREKPNGTRDLLQRQMSCRVQPTYTDRMCRHGNGSDHLYTPLCQGSGQISYQLYIDNSTQTFDFSQAKFDFASMTDTYDSKHLPPHSSSCRTDEACGKSVKMSYTQAAAEPYPIMCLWHYRHISAMIPTQPYATAKSYQTEQWETIIYNELKSRTPCIFTPDQPTNIADMPLSATDMTATDSIISIGAGAV